MNTVAKPKAHTYTPNNILKEFNSDIGEENFVSRKTFLKDPGSAITHFIGIVLSCIGAVLIISKAMHQIRPDAAIACAVFIVSMVLLYTASTLYHSIYASEKITLALKKFDHIMIYFLIAGTYTPICILALPKDIGIRLLLMIWVLALFGLVLTTIWVTSPKWLNSMIYIVMGWLCVFAFKPLFNSISGAAFGWLLSGGIIYTIGGVIYALKLPIFNNLHKNFGSHEIFHLFVLAGSICHFYMIYTYLLH